MSIDIADIDVGDNVGARLQADRAEADTRVARANAERRRAEAVAAEQEMVARIEESRAMVVKQRRTCHAHSQTPSRSDHCALKIITS